MICKQQREVLTGERGDGAPNLLCLLFALPLPQLLGGEWGLECHIRNQFIHIREDKYDPDGRRSSRILASARLRMAHREPHISRLKPLRERSLKVARPAALHRAEL
jgi:hypothetical protein